jgi:hypothetical protein
MLTNACAFPANLDQALGDKPGASQKKDKPDNFAAKWWHITLLQYILYGHADKEKYCGEQQVQPNRFKQFHVLI